MPKRKTKRSSTYDSSLQAGYNLMRNFSSNLNKSINDNSRFGVGITPRPDYGTTGEDVYTPNVENLDESVLKSKKSSSSTVSEEPTSTKKGFFGRMWDTVSGTISDAASNTYDALFGTDDTSVSDKLKNADVLSSYNLLQKRRLEAEMGAKQNDLRVTQGNIEDLDFVQNTYIPLLEQRQNIETQISKLKSAGVLSTDPRVSQLYKTKIAVDKQIDSIENKFKTDGKYSESLRPLFYDVANLENVSDEEKSKISRDVFKTLYTYDDNLKKQEDYSSFLKGLKSVVVTGSMEVASQIGNTITALSHDVERTVGLESRNDQIRRAVSMTAPEDRRFDNLFTQYGKAGKPTINQLRNKVLQAKKEYQRIADEQKANVVSTRNKLKKGAWWYSPKNINPEFEKIQSKDRGLVGGLAPHNILYALPELGSSWSDAEDFAAMVGTDLMVNKVVVPALVAVATKNPEAAAAASAAASGAEAVQHLSKFRKALNAYKAAKGTINSAKASGDIMRNVYRFADTEQKLNNANRILNVMHASAAAEAAAQVALLESQRRHESNSEVMDAYSSRVMSDAIKYNANMPLVMKQIDEYAQAMGDDWSDMSNDQKMAMALAFNVKTTDPTFERIKKNARKGLNKVYNDNMALAVMDYSEALPYMSYFGSYMRSLGKLAGFGKAGRAFNAEARLFDQQLAERTANAMIDSNINKVASKILKNPGSLIAYNTASKYIKSRAKRYGSLMLKEGVEEGQQHLLQQRYARGEYDNIDDYNANVFALPSVISDLDLAQSALGSYIGINFGDPDNGTAELRQAMNIGATTSLLFPNAGVLTNVVKSKDDNLRNTLAQMRNDLTLRNLVKENYGKAQDRDHVGIFFNAMNKKGITADRLEASLRNLKNIESKQNGVDEEYVDHDIELMYDTYAMYHSNHINSMLESLNTKKGSDKHKTLIQNGVMYVNDFKNTFSKAIEQAGNENEEFDSLVESAKKEDFENNPQLKELVEKIVNKWEAEKKYHNAVTKKARKAWVDKHTQVVDDIELTEEQKDELNRIYNEEGAQAAKDYKNDLIEAANKEYRSVAEQQYDSMVKELESIENDAEASEEDRKSAKSALSVYREYSLSKEDAVDGILRLMFQKRALDNLTRLRDNLASRQQFNEFMVKELGVDINTDRLLATLDFLNDKIKEAKKHLTKKDLQRIKEYGDLPMSEGFDNLQMSRMANQAAYETLLPIAQAYVPTILPGRLFAPRKGLVKYRGIRWKELTDAEKQEYINKKRQEALDNGKEEPTEKQIIGMYSNEKKQQQAEYKRILDQFEKKQKEISVTDEQDLKPSDVADLDSLKRAMALQIILEQLQEASDRKYIANRMNEEERPLTGQDIENAEDGDVEAQEKVVQEEKKQSEDDIEEYINNMSPQPENNGEVDTDDGTYNEDDDEAEVARLLDDTDSESQDIYDALSGESERDRAAQRRLQQKQKSQSVKDRQYEAAQSDDKVDQGEEAEVKNPVDEPEAPKDAVSNTTLPEEEVEKAASAEDEKPEEGEEPKATPVVQEPTSSNDPDTGSEKTGNGDPDNGQLDSDDYNETMDLGDEESPNLDTDESSDLNINDDGDSSLNLDIDESAGVKNIDIDPNESTMQVDIDHGAVDPYDASRISVDENGIVSRDGSGISVYDYEDEQELLQAYEHGLFSNSSEDEAGLTMPEGEAKGDIYRNYIGYTFFYSPTDKSTFHERRVNGKQLKFKYDIGSGFELSKQLLKKGWLENLYKNGNVYYVVSGDTNKTSNDIRDNLTINLVIDDHEAKKTYLLSMRTPGSYTFKAEKDGKIIDVPVDNGTRVIKQKLRMIGVDKELFDDNLRKQKRIAYQVDKKNINDPQPTPDQYSDTFEYEKAFRAWSARVDNWYYHQSKDVQEEIDYKTRVASRKHGVSKDRILTYPEIRRQLEVLKSTRNEIIEAYCVRNGDEITIPSEIKDSVKPSSISISNGKFVNNKDENTDLPIFRNMTGEEGGFGLSDDIEELTKQLESGEDGFLFGYGLGAFAEIGSKFNIRSIFNESQQFTSRGLAGKIYYFISDKKCPGTNRKGTKIPIMLHEERFNTQEREDGTSVRIHNASDVQLMLDPNTGDIINSESGRKPSAAEIILYLMCGRLNSRFIPNFNSELEQLFCDIFVNNGDHTLITAKKFDKHGRDIRSIEQIITSKLPYYCSKQLAFSERHGEGNYEIYVGTENGRLCITPNQLFPSQTATNEEKEAAAELRQTVVYLISQNMHWNTDVKQLAKPIDSQVLSSIRAYFNANPNATTFSICGNSQLSFNKNDLFNTDKNGKIVSNKKVSLLALMLKNGKLQTNVDSSVFKDPFVFANGIKQSSKDKTIHTIEKQQIDQKAEKPANSIVEAQAKQKSKKALSSVDEESLAGIHAKMKSRSSLFDKLIKRSEEEKQAILDSYDSVSKEHGGMQDILALNTNGKLRDKSDVEKLIKEQLQKYSDYLKKTGKEPLDLSKVKYNVDSFWTKRIKFNKNGIIPVAYVYKDGTVELSAQSVESINSQMSGFTGVFSTAKQRGRFNEETTRRWIEEKLGITSESVIVVSAVMRGCSNKAAYGTMLLATDAMSNALTPTMMFSREAGKGIHFHEAWHYVNLLIHNKNVRQKIYNEYVEKHPNLKNCTYREIEEIMAEDFRRYAEMREGYGLTNRVKRFFNNILDFLFQSRKKTQLRQIYDSILNGEYKGMSMDEESQKQFNSAYDRNNGVNYIVPGVEQKYIDSFKGINTYQQFYNIGTALAYRLINEYSLTTPEQIKAATQEQYQTLIKDIKDEIKHSNDPQRALVLQDIVSNQPAFKKIIYDVFKQYNIEVDFDRLIEESEAKDTGDQSIAEHTKDMMKVSKKDNVALRAKLFLTQIQKAKFEYDEADLNAGKQLVYAADDILGWAQYVPYNEAWNLVLDNLWSCDSYNEKDKQGHYLSTSIMGRCQNLSKSMAFFAVLYQKLQDEVGDDIQLQNQIFATVVSHKPQVAFFELQDPKEHKKKSSDEDYDSGDSMDDATMPKNDNRKKVYGDRERQWKLYNDNTLRAKRNLPRNWSKQFVLSGFVKNGKIRSAAVDNLVEKMRVIKKIQNSTKLPLEDKIVEIKEKLLDVIQSFGIPFDEEVLEHYISKNMKAEQDKDSFINQYDALKIILGSATDGNINHFVQIIKRSEGLKTLSLPVKGESANKPIDQLFSGYGLDKQISLMAEAYNEIHPSSTEFSVLGPDGSTIYPMSQNNELSDKIRHMNELYQEDIQNLSKSPYCKHSMLLSGVEEMRGSVEQLTGEDMYKLCVFVGLKESRTQDGSDYFGINPMEDYLAKMNMTFNNLMLLPTMADKKTWYAIKSNKIKMVHDLITYSQESETGAYKKRRFSDNTLNQFLGYYEDELNTLIQYYDRDNVKYLINHPDEIRKNYHGSVKKGSDGVMRMDASGNGGKFRYFYDLDLISTDDEEVIMNMNQYIQFLYEKEKAMMADPVAYGGASVIRNMGNDQDREKEDELDGFELIRGYLSNLKSQLINDPEVIADNINSMLMDIVDDELENLSQENGIYQPINIVNKNGDGTYSSKAIPNDILKYYSKQLEKAGYTFAGDYNTTPYTKGNVNLADMTLSAVASHVASYMISVIETEKVFTGDPAWYKYKSTKTGQTVTVTDDNGTFKAKVDNVFDKHADKIKRLGSVLSPGENIRSQYGKDVLEQYPELNRSTYTFMNVGDITGTLDEITLDNVTSRFKLQTAVNFISINPEIYFGAGLTKEEYTKRQSKLFSRWYSNYKNFLEDYEAWDDKTGTKEKIEKEASNAAGSYSDITVSDAQVCIRPWMYRYLRIALGEWTFEEDEDGYSDEKAYNIIEGLGEYENRKGEWQRDLELSKLVSKFQLKPLKMTYFANEFKQIHNIFHNMPVYNKMAIFPMFEYTCVSDTGRRLYERMNKPGSEIDMIGFDSSVKVGCNKNMWTPFNKGKGATSNYDELNPVSDNTSFDDAVSDNYIDENGEPQSRITPDTSVDDINNMLPVQIQYINKLRLQLNTDAHEANERPIGTQMFKIAMSNIFDNEDYGLGKTGENIKGEALKNDIMACINALSQIGANEIQDKFFGLNGRVSDKAVRKFIQTVIENNGLGSTVSEIINNGGTISSLMSRTLFEQSVSKKINKAVIDINTNGGSAVQQSIFGFTGNKNINNGQNVITRENVEAYGYHMPNAGRKLRWFKKGNSMEVILSMNFFRSILEGIKTDENGNITEDGKFNLWSNGTYDQQRNYLLSKKLIGSKTSPFGIGYRIPTQGMSSMFAFCVADVLARTAGDTIVVPDAFTAQTGSDFDVDKLYLATYSYKNGVKEQISPYKFNYDVNITNTDKDGKETTKKVHFTKYFGSKEQLDSFKEKLYDKYGEENVENQDEQLMQISDPKLTTRSRQNAYIHATKGAVGNQLLDNYMRVITDNRNFKQSRGSIDTITDYITKIIIPMISPSTNQYKRGMYELMPSFQEKTKMEFSTGKSGIAPFALSITNLALTEFTHLTMDYGDNLFELGDLDNPLSQDGSYVADWLSAMVNAHVDVAKDPYIFTINVNQATYPMTNFLIRAGKGAGTFTFLAQPSLKKYANIVNSSGGMYGDNIDGTQTGRKSADKVLSESLAEAKRVANAYFNNIDSSTLDDEAKAAYIKYSNYMSILNGETKAKDDPETAKELFRLVFDINLGAAAINQEDKGGTFFSKFYQFLTLYTFNELKPYADELSALVTHSRIDTKKFGNTVATQMNFVNAYKEFRYNSNRKIKWAINKNGVKITDGEFKGKTEDGKPIRDPNYALNVYFETTFLDDKLSKAVELTRRLLENQNYSATEQYQVLFKDVMCRKYGKTDILQTSTDSNGSLVSIEDYCYKPTKDEQSVKLIGQSLDDIIRYRVFNTFGKKMIANQEVDEENATGPIDFFNENPSDEFRRLIFGEPMKEGQEKPTYRNVSIFRRIGRLTRKAAEYGLEDNELLQFLTPVFEVSDDRETLPRLLLKSSQMNLAEQQKAILVSAFEQLLSHDDIDVRRLARDIARFAYFSSYDQNTVNSFFDLVPPAYRIQYDKALAYGLKDSYSTFEAICSDKDEQDIYGIMARNYWYNDKIVDEFVPSGFVAKDLYGKGDINIAKMEIKGETVYGAFLTNGTKTNSEYVKIKRTNDTYLYRKAGVIKMSFKDKKGKKTTRIYSAYVIVPKAGFHDGKHHYYEFFINSQQPSSFDGNTLPTPFQYNDYQKDGKDKKGLRTRILDIVEEANQQKENGDVVEFTESPSVNFAGTYYDKKKATPNVLSNPDGTVQFRIVSDANKATESLADYKISIEDGDTIKSIISRMKDSFGDANATEAKSISVTDNRTHEEPTSEEISEYIENKINDYATTLNQDGSLSEEEVNQKLDEYRDKVTEVAMENIQQQKEDEFMKELLSEAIYSGLKIKQTYGTSNIEGIALAKAARLMSNSIENGSTMFFSRKDKSDMMQNVITQLSTEIESSEPVIEDSQETEIKENIGEIVKQSDDFENLETLDLNDNSYNVDDSVASLDNVMSESNDSTLSMEEESFGLDLLLGDDDSLLKESEKPTEQSDDEDQFSDKC